MSLGRTKMKALPRRILAGLIWDLTVADATVTEGDTLAFSIGLNRQGIAAAEVSVLIRLMTTAELGVTDAEVAQSSNFASDILDTLTNAITAHNTAAGRTDVTLTNGSPNRTLTFASTMVFPFAIPRVTLPNFTSTLLTGLMIHTPSIGAVTIATAPATIADAETPPPTAPVYVTAPAISGSGVVGQSLTRIAGVLDAATYPTADVTWVWKNNTVDISGSANVPTYVIVTGDAGDSITLSETATNSEGTDTEVSAAVVVSSSNVAPTITSAPVLSGPNPPQVGIAMTIIPGGMLGTPTPTASYAMLQGDAAIVGTSYTPVAGDVGAPLQVRQTAANGVLPNATRDSAATANVVSAPGGDITDGTIAGAFLATGTNMVRGSLWTVYCPVDAANDTVIGALVGVGGALTAATMIDSQGGRFKITGSAPNFVLKVSTVVPDFMGPLVGVYVAPSGHGYYFPVIKFDGANSSTKTNTIRVCAHFAKVEPTGDETANVVTHTNTTGWLAGLRATASNRTDKISTSWIGVSEQNSATINFPGGNNRTFIGHRRWIGGKDRGISAAQGDNYIWYNMDIRPFKDATGADYDNRDCVYAGAQGFGPATNHLFIHCNFGCSIDELFSATGGNGPYPHNIMLYRCKASHPITAVDRTLHREGNHNQGVLFNNRSFNMVIIKSVIMACRQRYPNFGVMRGGLAANNICIGWNQGVTNGAICIAGAGGDATATPAVNEDRTHRIEANLFAGTTCVVTLLRTGSGSAIYIPQTTDPYANYSFTRPNGETGVGGSFTQVPIDPNNTTHVSTALGATREGLVNWRPFTNDIDAEILPTSTEAERRALWEDTWFKAGVHATNSDTIGDIIPGLASMNKINKYEMLNPTTPYSTIVGQANTVHLDTLWGATLTGGTQGVLTDVP